MAKTIKWNIGDNVENVEVKVGEALLKISGIVQEVKEQ